MVEFEEKYKLDFDGEEALSGYTLTPEQAKSLADTGKALFSTLAQKKQAKKDLDASLTQREKEKKACESNKEYRKFLDRKARNNKIRDCKNAIDKRYDEADRENRKILLAQTEANASTEKANAESTANIVKYIIIGGVSLIAIIGTIMIIKNKRNG